MHHVVAESHLAYGAQPVSQETQPAGLAEEENHAEMAEGDREPPDLIDAAREWWATENECASLSA